MSYFLQQDYSHHGVSRSVDSFPTPPHILSLPFPLHSAAQRLAELRVVSVLQASFSSLSTEPLQMTRQRCTPNSHLKTMIPAAIVSFSCYHFSANGRRAVIRKYNLEGALVNTKSMKLDEKAHHRLVSVVSSVCSLLSVAFLLSVSDF